METYKKRDITFIIHVMNNTQLLSVVNVIYNWKQKAIQLLFKNIINESHF